ncbi:prolyl oligopeptidase [Dichomitus squalens]|uniref:Prolyl endopeptidase n=1 Tax=Dichomitus squalens TaxID=114155 RepID=A0A4Q9MJU9_9APHY|nr:prolyl oligopeptidase [Dichomitus squalens]
MLTLFSFVAISLRAPPTAVAQSHIRRAVRQTFSTRRLVSTFHPLAMPANPTPWVPNRYPPARRSDHVDVYKSEKHREVRVHDPYHWLEQNTDETEQWTTAQEKFTREYLDQNPERKDLEDQIRNNMDYAKFSAPSLKNDGRWYWYHNTGLQAQSVLYRSKDSTLPDFSGLKDAGGEVFFDPNLLSSDGTSSIQVSAFSHSGSHYAYGVSRSGSDFCTIYVRPTSAPLAPVDGKRVSPDEGRLPEEIRFVKFSSISWTHDSQGFFYQRYPGRESHGPASEDKAETDSDKNAMLYYHRLGTQQSEDVLVYKDASNPEWMWGSEVTEVDGRYLLLSIRRDTSRKNLLWIADLQKDSIGANLVWDKLIDEFEANYEYIANDGTKFYLLTNKDAPQYKVVTVDLADAPGKRVFKDLIAHDENAHLQDVRPVNGDFAAVVYKRNVKDEIYLYQLSTGKQLQRVAPEFVGAASISGRREHSWFFATLGGFTNPGIVAKYDFNVKEEDKRWSIYRTTLVSGLNPEDFSVEQVWYSSKDGTRVPMFIVRHKDTKFDGTAPALQYGYGGFTISIDPFFSPAILTWMQKYGAILAVANIRGGGEFGEEWHLAGTRERKVNCFDDFIAATQYLVDNKYAAPGKVAINGGSNGGLLVAACVNRAPEGLLGAAVADVGVLDLLKFADFTIGRAWTSDYGDPHNPHDFDFIYPISPLHNIPTDKILPPTMLVTADHDDRVVPLHSFKHAATLQYLKADNPHPLLIRIDKKAGHGAGKSTQQRIQEWADKYGFIAQSLGLPARGG